MLTEHYLLSSLLFMIFWFVVYITEGTHDAYFDKECGTRPPAENKELELYFKGKWHTWDSYNYALIHLFISYLYTAVIVSGTGLPLLKTAAVFLSFLILSVTVRIFTHDLFYRIGKGESIKTVPSCQSKLFGFDWWDCIMVFLYEKTKVYPVVYRTIPIIVWFFIHIKILEKILCE